MGCHQCDLKRRKARPFAPGFTAAEVSFPWFGAGRHSVAGTDWRAPKGRRSQGDVGQVDRPVSRNPARQASFSEIYGKLARARKPRDSQELLLTHADLALSAFW